MDANDTSCFFSADGPTLSQLESLTIIEGSSSGLCDLFILVRDGRRRVLKCLKPKYRGLPAYEALLRKEYEIGHTLSCPYICEVYGFTQREDLGWCIEMEWIDGLPLDKYLETVQPGRALKYRLLDQLFEAVGYFHSKQVVHKDLKPSNILVTNNGANIKILDFGFANRDADSELKLSAGTEKYAAPELIAGLSVDNRADIYSLGKILPLFGRGWRRIIRKCSQVDPERRYKTVQELQQAIAATRRTWLRWLLPSLLLLSILPILGLTRERPKTSSDVKFVTVTVEETPVCHLWRKGDRIYLSDKKNRPTYDALSSGATVKFRHTQENTSTLNPDSTAIWAFYPVSIKSKLPPVQEYASDGPSLYPMAGFYKYNHQGRLTPKFTMRSLCGYIRINLTASQPIRVCKIVFHSEKGLTGRYTVNSLSVMKWKGSGNLELSCPEVPVGTTPVPFFIAVPPTTYSDLSATIHTAEGDTFIWTQPASSHLEVVRGEMIQVDMDLR